MEIEDLQRFKGSAEYKELERAFKISLQYRGINSKIRKAIEEILRSDLSTNPKMVELLKNNDDPKQQKLAYNLLEKRVRSEAEKILLPKLINEYVHEHKKGLINKINTELGNFDKRNKPKQNRRRY